MITDKEYTVWIEVPVRVRVTHYTPGDPGRLSGPPESCYPPEPSEIEYELVEPEAIIELLNSSEKVYDEVLEAHETWLDRD